MSQNVTTRSILKREQVQVDERIEHYQPREAYASPRTITCTLYTITKSDSSSSVLEREQEQATKGKTTAKKDREQQESRFIHTKDRERRPSKRGWQRTQLGYFKADGRLGIISDSLFGIISRLSIGDYDMSFVRCTTPAESSICGDSED